MENLNLEEKRIKKCLKSYLTAKKYYESDIEKSYEYFKQCITILNDIRKQNKLSNTEFNEIMDETETECAKYITLAIEATLDKPQEKRKYVSDNNELFEIIELGNLDALKKYSYGEIDFSLTNVEGLTPLHYAIKVGDTGFIKQSLKLGAGIDQTNKNGHTLLEYACLEKDPNMINFLLTYGADMKKHLVFRDSKKYFSHSNHMDLCLIEKYVMEMVDTDNNYKIKHMDWVFKYLDQNENIHIDYCDPNNSTILTGHIKIFNFIQKLDYMLDLFEDNIRNTYISIIKEELNYNLSYKLGCPNSKIEILLYNLVPFINYEFNLKLNWLVSLEIKYLIIKILKNKVKINTHQLKDELKELLYNTYIENGIIPEGLIQIIVLQWLHKIKV